MKIGSFAYFISIFFQYFLFLKFGFSILICTDTKKKSKFLKAKNIIFQAISTDFKRFINYSYNLHNS